MELKPENLVIGEVVGFEEFGIVLKLDDYDKEAFLHISEIRLRRGERMDDRIKLKSKLVVRVLREDKKSGKVFVSVKQISDDEAKTEMRLWKERRNAISIVQTAISGRIDDSTFIARMEKKAVDKYGSLGNALRVAIEEGQKSLVKLGFPPELCNEVLVLARKELARRRTKRTKRMRIMFTSSDGVDLLKKATSGMGAPEDGIFVAVRSEAPPLYYVTAYGPSPKQTSSRLEDAVETIAKKVENLGGYAEVLQ